MWLKFSKRGAVNSDALRSIEIDSVQGSWQIQGMQAQNLPPVVLFRSSDVETCEKVLGYALKAMNASVVEFDFTDYEK